MASTGPPTAFSSFIAVEDSGEGRFMWGAITELENSGEVGVGDN